MGYEGASGFHPPGGGGGGGTIGGGGTVNYIPVFSPDGTHIGNSIMFQDPGSNAAVIERISSASITTIDLLVPVAVSLQTIAIPLNTVVMIECYVTCRKTAGIGAGVIGDGNGYIRTVVAQNIAGVVTIGIIQSSFTSETIVANDATFTPIGTNVLMEVTGSVNNTFNWNVITKIYPVV